ncbi:hypothetical protein INR49_012848, partial [Caranx melampygus]
VLGESMVRISQNAKNTNLPESGDPVNGASKASAYLVECQAPTAGQKGLVDPTQFSWADQSIQMAFQNLVDPASTQSQVLFAATIMARHTSALCKAVAWPPPKPPAL